MNISKQGKTLSKTLRWVFIVLSILFAALLPQFLLAEDQIINVSQAQINESSELSEKQLSEVNGRGFELVVILNQERSSIILWDERANSRTDISVATGTMNQQSNTLSVWGR